MFKGNRKHLSSDQAIDFLADQLAGDPEDYHNSLQTYEQHLAATKIKLTQMMKNGQQRFMQGYGVIIEELRKEMTE